jgi:CysZ protein
VITRFLHGFVLPIEGGVFLWQHRSLRLLAVTPFLLNTVLYTIAVTLFVRFYDTWFGLILDRPEVWYWLIGYYVLRSLAFLVVVAIFIFSFVFVGTILSAPFLDLLSERTEAVLRGTRNDQPFRIHQWIGDVLRSVGHSLMTILTLIAAFPLSFIPIIGHATWLGVGWLLLTYDFTSFTLDRRRLAFREKWRWLLADLSGTVGFGAALFFLMVIPVVGLVSLPVAAVAGTMLVLEREESTQNKA